MTRAGLAVTIIALAAAASAALPSLLGQQPPAPVTRPTTRTNDCTTAGCHTAQVNRKVLHGPTAVGACDACHEYKDDKAHTFQLKRKGKDLCEFCHIDKHGTEGPVVHKPVADGNCTGCHDPHGASNHQMLIRDTSPQLCVTCHKETVHGANVHKPVADDCAACHKPHTADYPKLLKAPARDLCLSCHQDVGTTAATAKHPHDPAKGDCLQCHAPHATDQIKGLKSSPADLCTSCHQDVGKQAAAATHKHPAVSDARACLNCHTPHGSTRDKQLAADPIASCMNCHKAAIVVSKDRTIPAVPEVAATTLHRHGPLEMGNCTGCHDAHGATQDHLLAANYAPTFYQKYDEAAFALCFKCHDKTLITAVTPPAPGAKQTGFRNGDVNLHAVHVNTGDKSKSCRACHTVHASRNSEQIADTVQFGQWKLPINFAATATGGSCAPGCHKPLSYDRGKPVTPAPGTPAPPAPTAPPTPAAAPASPLPAKPT